MPVDRTAAAQAISAFLQALGHPPEGELEGTPERVVDAFVDELLAGAAVDPASLLLDGSAPTPDPAATVLVRDVDVTTVCPHHLLPAVGRASVAYGPGSQVFGIGTVARVVDAFARRLTLQEAIGKNVVDALTGPGGARWAICRLELMHTCLATRGARQPHARVVTLSTAGDVPPGTPLTAPDESR